MDLDQTLAALEAAGTAKNREVYARHGVGEPLYGVSYAELGKLQKAIKKDHDLALRLWATGNHDARILATKIADPKAATADELSGWVGDVDSYVAADAVADVVAQSPHAAELSDRLMSSPDEWPARIGWSVLARRALAKDADGLDAERGRELMAIIERDVHGAPNRARDAMLSALAALGLMSEELAEESIATAERIGLVEVDHGETGCKNPDIEKMVTNGWARKRARAEKARQKKANG